MLWFERIGDDSNKASEALWCNRLLWVVVAEQTKRDNAHTTTRLEALCSVPKTQNMYSAYYHNSYLARSKIADHDGHLQGRCHQDRKNCGARQLACWVHNEGGH